MILLDSDHLTALKYRGSARYDRLTARLEDAGDDVGTTIANVEEQMCGWLASIAKERAVIRQVPAYRKLAELFEFFGGLHVLTLTEVAANRFAELRAAGTRIGTVDLKAACISLVHDALFLAANRKDFEKVAGLRFANWLE